MNSGINLKITDFPYYAVLFTSLYADNHVGYKEMNDKMSELVTKQPGYLGMESARGADGLGITISYWKDKESIISWKKNMEHQIAQYKGRKTWYSYYKICVCAVERSYEFKKMN